VTSRDLMVGLRVTDGCADRPRSTYACTPAQLAGAVERGRPHPLETPTGYFHMNPKTSHKIIAAGTMAAAIGIGVAMFATRSHPAATSPDLAIPTPPAAQSSTGAPDAQGAPAATSDAAVPVHEAPAALAQSDGIGVTSSFTSTTSALGDPHGRSQRAADESAVVSGDRTPETVAHRVTRLRSNDVGAAWLAPERSPAVDSSVATSAALPASDSQITTDVKTAIAGDLVVKDLEIGVSTTDGVVALTGSVATQGAIDQAKDVAAKVKDVKGVDTSALILASL